MKPNRLLKAAAWLWALTVISAGLLPGGTQAKYAAGAQGIGTAQVAKWGPFERYKEKYPEAEDDGTGAPVLVAFAADADDEDRTATLSLVNRSEVTARYVLVADVDEVAGETDKEDPVVVNFLAAIHASLNDNADYDDGIVLGYTGQANDSATLDVVIPNTTFKGLTITAYAVQVD